MSQSAATSIAPPGKQDRFGFLFCLVYFVCYASALVLLALKWPIHPPDTDLWYHLTSGRYFFETGLLPNNSFFSFVEPVREGISYFWGFQVLVYWVYDHWGYSGLIAYRGLLLAAVLAATYALVLLKGSKRHPFLILALIGGIIPIVFVTRFFLIRPHATTFLFVALFLLILESGKKRWLLPFLAVIWMNLHGIVYPLMYWILFAYAVDLWHDRFRYKIPLRTTLRNIAPLLLTLAAPFMTPNGVKLLAVPWESTSNASSYIGELAAPSISNLLSFHFLELGPTESTAYNLMLFFALVSLIISFYKRPMRFNHWILLAGSLLLIQKGVRFQTESILLLIPLILDNPWISKDNFAKLFADRKTRYYAMTLLLSGLLVVVPYCYVFRKLKSQVPAYPESRINTPVGSVQFLKNIGYSGNILNEPNTGGYVQWGLYPQYKIFMDMKIPFLFKDEDIFVALHLYTTPALFERVTERHDILCALVPARAYTSPDPLFLDTHPKFKLVFFDDVEALYCDQTRMPEIVNEYELKHLKPREVFNHTAKLHLEESLEHAAMLREAQRMLAIDPGIHYANILAADIHLLAQDYGAVLPHAEALIRAYPDNAQGYGYKVEALYGLGEAGAVIDTYRQCKRRSDVSLTSNQIAQVAASHLKLDNFATAYGLFQSIPFFTGRRPFEHIYAYAIAAERGGHQEQSAELYAYANLLKPDDGEMARRAERYLEFLNITLGEAIQDLDNRHAERER